MYMEYFSIHPGDLHSPHFFREEERKNRKKREKEKTLTAKSALKSNCYIAPTPLLKILFSPTPEPLSKKSSLEDCLSTEQ